MRKTVASIALATCALVVLPAQAGGGETAAGAAFGAVTGALLGHHSGGRDGAIVGGALGGAIGAAIGSEYRRDDVRYVDYRYDNDRRYYRGPNRVIVRENYYPRRPVIVERRVVIRDHAHCRDHRHRHGHGRRGEYRRYDRH
jgi:hypothetical protein